MSQTLRGTACHEAGHAIVAIAVGYEVTEVCLKEASSSDPEGKWNGCSNYAPGSFKCPQCKACVDDIHDASQIGLLTDECPDCEAERARFGKRVLAGGVATRDLEPQDHDPYLMGFDNKKLFMAYPNSRDRQTTYAAADVAATDGVRQLKCAIEELRDLIIRRAKAASRFGIVCVSGPEVMAISEKYVTLLE
jgi:hypothetical protein